MASLESDDDLETTGNDTESAEVEDIVWSDTDEGDLHTDRQTKSILIDLNSRIILKSKEMRTPQRYVESDSCITQFHIGNVDFPSTVEETSGNVSSSEEFEISDDETKLISRSVNVNSLDLHSFVNVKTMDNSAGTNKFSTEARDQFGVKTHDPDTVSTSKLSFEEKPFQVDAVNKKKCFFANLHGHRLSQFKPKSSATMFSEFVQTITDDNDDDVFEPADSNVSHNVSSQHLKLIDDTELEELTLTTESDGTVSLSQNVKPQLRHRFNRSYRQDGFDDSEINTTYVVEHPNLHTDDEIFSDEASSPVMRKIKKSHKKCKNQSDDESTEEEEFLDDPYVTGKELSAKPRRKMKEWTETDESGGLKQVTQIKTETSIKVVGGKEVPCNDEELLSFVEKRNFFQKLSLTSDNLPTTTKWTQEVSLDDIPMAQGEIVKEQISFEDKLKMFEHDEENYRRKIQKNGKQDQPTVYRYDFTKSGKEKVPIPSDMEKAEAIIKKVNDELTNGELVTSSNSTKQLVTRQSCSLEAAEQEVSTLLAEVGREEQCDDAEEIADSIISSENMDTGVSAVEIDDSDDFGLDERRMSDGAFIESPVSDQEGENIADLGYHEETNFAEDSLSVRECSSSRIDSLEQSEAIVEEVEVKVTERTCHVEEHIFEANLPEDSSLTGQRATTVSPFTLEELHEEGTVCRDYRRESFREALELEAEDKSELNTDSKKNNSLKELPIQNLDISAVVKSQILNEELGQSIEDSPLEVKHISEEFEKAAVVSTTHQGEVYKHIKTEIFSQELGEDIESGSPEHKDISPVNPSIDVSELFAKEVSDSKTAETEDNMTKDTADEDVPDFQPLSPSENIEHDDLEEYEEAKDEHSLSEQLLALASNMPQPVKCIEDEDFLDDESSPNVPLHAIYDPSMPRRSTACRKGKETGYTRIDKKEIRRFKTTKQVSTIEEHSSIESSDSPQELFHHDFSENHLNEMGVKLSDDQKVSESTDSSFVPDETQSDFKQGEVAEVPLISNTTSKADDLEEGTKTDLPCVPADDKHKSDSESLPGDHEPHLTKTDTQPTYSKLPSPTSDSKSSKDSKKGDFDNESKLPCAELLAPTKKDESFSSSGEMESHYYSAEASDSGKTPRSTPVGSRPTSSEFEVNVLSGPGSEYETCVTSQDGTGDLSGSYSTAATSQETSYSTACSSFSHSSRESAHSVDSESSGHLASVEISSEASETLVPSAQEMELEFATEFEMPVLDEEVTSLKEPYDMEIPESVIRSGVELPFLTNWDMQANQSEPVGETSQWPWQRPEQSESFSDYGNVKPVEHDGSTPLVEEITRQSGMFSLPSDSCAEAAYSSQPSSFIQQSFTDDSEKKDSSTDSKQSEMSGLRKAHFAFSSETQSSMHAYGLPQETDGTADSSSACVEEEQLSVSESSATHSEQTWQTSSLDTAVQITSQLPVSSVILDTQTSVSVTDSLSDVQPEVSASSEQVMVAAEHQMPYLQLNGPIEVDYNPEYDAFDVDDSAQPEDAPQLGFQLDELQFELEEENDVPENHAIANGIPENGIESLQGEMHEDEGDNFNVVAENDDVQCDIVTENVSALNGASACVGTLTEAEKPEAQQEQEVQYREFEDNLRSENVTFQDQTSYLPESDQENLRSLASENFEQEPSVSTHDALQEADDQDDQEAVVDIEVCNEPKASSSDSVDKAEVVDTFPEDERYDCLFQKPETSDAKIFDSSDISETNDLLESDAGVYSGFQPDLYTHHEDDMELKESDMFPSPIPEESKQSTPSFDVIPGRKFFSRSGDTSAASSLQEFERLEADIAAGRCSQTSAGSLEKPISGKSVESEDLARRMLHRSGETSAASSLQEFERLEAEFAAGRISRASLDSYEKVASGKSVESDHLVRRMNLHSEENSTASSLQEFERLEAEFAAGRISRSSAESVEKPAVSRSGEHDNISMSSLTDFEKLETEFSEQEQTTKVCEVGSVLPEIGEGLESQISESRIDPLSVDQDHADSDDSEYEKRMTEMEEVIKLAQTNVEKFHEETVEDLSEGMTYEEYTVTHTSDSSQKYTDTDVETVANANDFEARPKKGGKNSDDTEIHTDVSAADNGTGGHDDSSNSSKNGKVDCMVSSTDSVDPSSSTATHATYQFETDSVMSSSINSAQASGEECTMVSSTDTLESETKLTYSQGELGSEDNAAIAGGIVSESNFVQVSSYEFPCDIAESLDKPQEMEMFLTNLTHKSIVPDDQMSSEHVSLSLHTSSMSPSDLDHRAGNSPAISCGQCTSSAEMSGLSQQDEDAGDDEVVSHTTTTTTRIVTTVTTDDGVVQEEQEGGDELRRSMEEVLNQFMTEETTQDVSSAKH